MRHIGWTKFDDHIGYGDGSVIILDYKGNPELFQTVLLGAQRTGHRFKCISGKAHYVTYILNILTQRFLP